MLSDERLAEIKSKYLKPLTLVYGRDEQNRPIAISGENPAAKDIDDLLAEVNRLRRRCAVFYDDGLCECGGVLREERR